MKKALKSFGIIAILAVILFSMVACDDGATNGNETTAYTVSYDAGDGSGTAPQNQTVPSGTIIYLPGQSGMIAPSGKNFSGWRTGGQNYQVGDSFAVYSNTIFIAQWITGSTGGSTTVPSTPTGFSVYSSTNVTSSSLFMTWDTVNGATGYNVYRSLTASGTYSLRGSTTFSSYTDEGLSPSTTYYYRVSAYNSAGESPMSSYDYSTTASSSGGDPTVPNAPTGVIVTRQSASNVYITWNPVSGATSYKVYWSYTSSGTFSLAGTTSSTNYTDTGWGASETGYIRVSAVNSAGEGPQSSSVSFPAFSSGGSVPGTPTGVTATRNPAGSTTVRITWNVVSGATSYKVYYSSSSSGSGTLDGTSSTTSYDSFSNSTDFTWYFRVSAVNSAGEGSPSSWVSVGPVETVPNAPSAPSGITATAQSSSSIRISWSTVTGATGYYIYRSSSASGTYTQVGDSTSTSYTNTGLSQNTTYHYRVASYNTAGTSSQSSSVSATTTREYNVGDTGPGNGKIFYKSTAGFTMTGSSQICYYLEAAPYDIATTQRWLVSGGSNAEIATGTGIGAGRNNTTLIINAIDSPAARACRDYSSGGMTDWFLPSRDELNQMYQNRNVIGNMGTGEYWTSSQFIAGASMCQNFSNGTQTASRNQFLAYAVRAIRAF